MNLQAFENLELLPTILNELQNVKSELDNLKNLFKSSSPDLCTRKGVKEYLNISEGTLNNMMSDGRLKEGIHFTKSLNKKRAKITFIESAIIGYKDSK